MTVGVYFGCRFERVELLNLEYLEARKSAAAPRRISEAGHGIVAGKLKTCASVLSMMEAGRPCAFEYVAVFICSSRMWGNITNSFNSRKSQMPQFMRGKPSWVPCCKRYLRATAMNNIERNDRVCKDSFGCQSCSCSPLSHAVAVAKRSSSFEGGVHISGLGRFLRMLLFGVSNAYTTTQPRALSPPQHPTASFT